MRKVNVLVALATTCFVASGAFAEISFRPATTSPQAGWKMMSSADGRYYVSSDVAMTSEQITATQVLNDGKALAITTNADLSGTDRVAIFVDGEFVSAPKFRTSQGRITLEGLSRTTGAHLVNILGNTGATDGATVFVRTAQKQVRPGESFEAEVFVSNVQNLNTYQVRVNATTADRGRLRVNSMRIDKEREDYAMDGEVIDAVDSVDYRLGGLMLNGTQVTSNEPLYLGTYTFTAPENGSAVYVNIEVGSESFLRDPNANSIAFRLGAPAAVKVGTRANLSGR